MHLSHGTALILCSALLHAIWNALLKRAGSGPQAAKILLRTSMASAWIWFFAIHRSGTPFFVNPRELLPGAILAGIFDGFYFLFLQKTLLNFPLNWAYLATRGGAMLWVWIASLLWLQESVLPLQMVGVLLIGCGLIASTLGVKHPPQTATRTGVLLAAATSLMIAGYHLTYKRAIGLGAEPVALFAISILVSCLIMEITTYKKRETAPVALAPTILAGILATTSFVLFLEGLGSVGAGISITLRNTSILFAQLFGIFLGERLTAKQWFACAVVIAGALLL